MIAPKNIKGQERNPIRILHLEDSEQDHLLMRKALSSAQVVFEATRVESLSGFQQQLAETLYDIVLADYHLHGFTALDAWDLIPPNFQGAFILVSGAIGESAAVKAIQRGMSDYLHKDDLFKLPRVIDRSLELKRLSEEKVAADKDLLESKTRLAQFAGHLQDTIESERASIAREIHDDIGGSLAAIRLDLSWAARHISDPNVLARIDTANSMLSHALGASQRIMRNLRPSILDQGLLAAARGLAEDFERRTGIEARCNFAHCNAEHTKEIELAAYRTVQEALTNISKYARATVVVLDISDVDGVLTVEVCDNGVGIAALDLTKGAAFGLRGLEERAAAVGGWLDVSTTEGNGTAVILTVPLSNS
ncbi:MAG: hypothetical protein CFE44_00630 [Burkholderiales bacterium PBB4]|nr:MAG: hypothetical protein CFE44_00630 [Burkholderiales bacterium PBB4]